jgi:hypothetical protein
MSTRMASQNACGRAQADQRGERDLGSMRSLARRAIGEWPVVIWTWRLLGRNKLRLNFRIWKH